MGIDDIELKNPTILYNDDDDEAEAMCFELGKAGYDMVIL